MKMHTLLEKQKDYFAGHNTYSYAFRKEQLLTLRRLIVENENALIEAVRADFGKPPFETFFSEVDFCLREIDFAKKHLRKWMRKKRVSTSLLTQPAASHIYPMPIGSVLIIGAWNYPIMELFAPLVGAIAAGCTAVLKPSEFSMHTAKLLEKLCTNYFEDQYISVINGNAKISAELTTLPFDHICFTGSTHVGKLVMKAASENLTPVTLELGGKSPCIVDSNTDISLTAKRIIWGKCYNAGQTCIAPDYILVQKSVKKDFIKACKFWIREFYGKNIIQNRDYARIINDKHFDRLTSYLKYGKIVVGGRTDKNVLFIEPTLIDTPELDSPLMQEEIFGPILPIIEYQNFDDALSFITTRPKPLATYLFSLDKHKQKQLVRMIHTGGITINDTLIHSASRTLPYGGVGASGFGSYHGKAGFDTFTHHRPVLTASQRFDQNLRYPPFGDKLNWVRKIVRYVR